MSIIKGLGYAVLLGILALIVAVAVADRLSAELRPSSPSATTSAR